MSDNNAEEVQWFGGNEEPDFEDGFRFYADGSIRVPTDEEKDANKQRMRRYYFTVNQAKRRNADPHEWRDRDGWRMVVTRHSRVFGVFDRGRVVDYRDGFRANITHPARSRLRKLHRWITTPMVPYRGQAVADGLELLASTRAARRAAAARRAMEYARADHALAARLLADVFGGRERYDVRRAFAR